ncbi:DNA polymerase III subunit chi [Pseudomonas sp. dw_358]|uniref:DNA polymerase III subunit chi n=1 Tax=Pseudomonas sp. dw_358 TaxID=2720083 RepID=UPI001BD5C2D8|nr:DNA polymerase III subunit chi [Pseudomonas sp. dw_358]
MDNFKPLPKSAHLLDDLESIRQLLGDETLQPPLLTEAVPHEREQIPLLLDVEGETEALQQAPSAAAAPLARPAVAEATPERNRQDTLLHLDADLRSAAQQIMQDVIDDFAPHIETEIKRRLEARLERLLQP